MRPILSGFLLMLFGCGSKEPYQKKAGVWYFDDQRMADPGPDGFAPLSGPFAKSSGSAYYRGSPIPDSDGPTFTALSDHYAKDKQRVFYADTYRKGQEYYTVKHDRTVILSSADAATFHYLERGYARDASHVFFEGQPMLVKDAATFALLDYSFARDRVTGYYLQKPIPGTDGATFTGVDNHYSKDKTHVFYSDLDMSEANSPVIRTIVVKGAQPAQFVALEPGYGKSGDITYYRGVAVLAAKPQP